MVRSNWRGPLVVVLALVATASADTPAPLPAPTKPGDRLITVQELNRPAQVCRIVYNWRTLDGAEAYQVQAVDTGEMLTITENGTLATPPSPGRRVRAVATRIYHWGHSLRSPAGVPMPPADVVASEPFQSPLVVKLPPGDTRVNMPTPPLTVSAPSRTLPREQPEPTIVQTQSPMPAPQMPVAERLLPRETRIDSPPPVVTTMPAPLKGEPSAPLAGQGPSPVPHRPVAERMQPGDTRIVPPAPGLTTLPAPLKGEPSVPLAGQAPSPSRPRKPVPAVTASLQKKPGEKGDPAVPSPYAEHHWPTAFSGQRPVEVASVTPTAPPPAQREPAVLPPVAPVQPAADPVAGKSLAVPAATQVNPATCSTPVTSTVAGPCEPPKHPLLHKIFKRDSKDPCCNDPCAKDPCAKDPCAKDPCAKDPYATVPVAGAPPMPKPSETQKTARPEPSKTIESHPIAQTPTDPTDWRKSWGSPNPRKSEEPIAKTTTPISTAPKPLAQIASEPAAPPKANEDSTQPEKRRPFWLRMADPKEVKKAETASKPAKTPAPAAPKSTAADWGGTGKKQEDVATRSTKGPETGVRQPPTYLPETPLPRARTEQDRDPLARPSDYAKRQLLDTKTDVAKLTETKKTDKKPDVAQASIKEPPPASKTGSATSATATEPAGNPPGSGSVLAAGAPQYIPVPIVTVPNTMQQPTPPVPPMPPMPNIPQGPNPNQGLYTHPNPLTVPPRGYRNAFTNPGPENPVPAETIPPETSTNAFAPPQYEGQGTPPPAIPALMRNTPSLSPGPIVPVPPGTPVGGIPMKALPQQGMPQQYAGPMQGMPMQGMPMQGMPQQQMPYPAQGMPQQQLPYPMQGMPQQQQLPVPMQSMPIQQPQLPAMPVQPMGPGAQQGVPGMAWMPRQQFVAANYYHIPAASQVNVYTAPQGMAAGYQQPQPQTDGQPNLALLLQMLRESDYPSQREWAAEQLASQGGRVSPAVVSSLVTAAKEDPAPMVRTQCIRSLARMQVSTLPVASLLQQLQNDSDPRVRDAVLEAMTAMGMPMPRKDPGVQPVSAPVMKGAN